MKTSAGQDPDEAKIAAALEPVDDDGVYDSWGLDQVGDEGLNKNCKLNFSDLEVHLSYYARRPAGACGEVHDATGMDVRGAVRPTQSKVTRPLST